ncbi:PEP-CTERM sorting domain-containing protein [Psychromonas sp. PT13]|uniref:PEP-CTERM sorting domain-containing protein n=1 Tax=Psychromonas sp. PT13 TaxID=3439547 RepID=UPI003EB790A5
MNLFKTAATAALLLTSASTFASTISFTSGLDDVCTSSSCDLTDQDFYTYVEPTDGASWIQDGNAWYVSGAEYSIYEYDFSATGSDYSIDSLFVSYDDNLVITIGTDVIFDSTTTSITDAWTTYTDITTLLSSAYITAGDYLTFYVDNNGGLATGVAWSGTATSVPEPSMVIALGLGLVAFGVRRRKNTNV